MQLKVTTHTEDVYLVEDTAYDAVAVNEMLNDNNVLTVVIGGVIFSRIDIKRIEPYTVQATNAE